MASHGDLATELYQWAFEEMHFRPQGQHVNTKLPALDEMRSICRGQMVDIWKFVTSHVYSAQTVRKVQGNLNLKGKGFVTQSYQVKYKHPSQYSKERDELTNERKRLHFELQNIQASIYHIEKDLQQFQREVIVSDESYRDASKTIKDLQHKSALLKHHSCMVAQDKNCLEEYTKRMKKKIEKYKQLQSLGVWKCERYYPKVFSPPSKAFVEHTFYTREEIEKAGAAGLESECSKKLRETCTDIGAFLHSLLEGAFNEDKSNLVAKKDVMWRKVENAFIEFPVNQLIVSLVTNTQEAALCVREKTTKIDIKKDAERLRFKYESGGQLCDLSTTPSILQGVHQLIEETQLSHINRFVEGERLRNRSFRLQQKLSDIKTQIDFQLQKIFNGNPGGLELARSLIQCEIDVADSRASLGCLEGVLNDLNVQITDLAHERELLHAKYQRIQDFRKLADNKQALIRVLVKQNNSAQTRLAGQKNEILKSVQTSLCSQENEAKISMSGLQNSVGREVDAFAGLSLPSVMITQLERGLKLPICELSINRLWNELNPGNAQLQRVMNFLLFPVFKSPESLLETVINLKYDTDDVESQLELHSVSAQMLEGSHRGQGAILEYITRLCDAVSDHDHKQISRVLPVIQKRLTRAGQGMAACADVRDRMETWWSQPAQDTVPWMEVEGGKLQQWKDQWTVITTRLRQLKRQN